MKGETGEWGEWTVAIASCDGDWGVLLEHNKLGDDGVETFTTGMPPDVADDLARALHDKAEAARERNT